MQRTSHIALAFALLVLAGACTTAAPDRAANDPGGALPGAASVTFTPGATPADAVAAVRDLEVALRRDNRERAEIANLGPGAAELAALMDRTGSFLLAQAAVTLDRAGEVSLVRSIVPVAPTAATVTRLAGLPPPGMALLTPWASAMGLFEQAMANPRATSFTKSSTDDVNAGGTSGSISTSVTTTITINGSKVSLDLKLSTTGEAHDATGATVYRIASDGTAHVDADACPDATGLVNGHMDFTGHESYFAGAGGGGAGNGLDQRFTGDVRINADDEAKLADFHGEATGHEDSRGGVGKSGASAGDLRAYSLDATGTFGQDTGHYQTDGAGTTVAEARRVGLDMLKIVGISAYATAKAVETAWRSGRCIAVVVDPEGGDVERSSVTPVTAKVRHKFEKNELTKPVEATLSGVKQIEPAGKRRPAPATFTYTAGPADGDKGEVTFTSVSNRGIGKTQVVFTVGGGWTIGSVGTFDELRDEGAGPTRILLKVTISDLKVTTGKDDALSGSGSIRLAGDVTGGFGPVSCAGHADHTYAATATGALVGSGPNAVLRLTFHVPPSGVGELVTLKCTPEGSIPFPFVGDGELYAIALGAIDIPAAGGSVRVDHGGATATVTAIRAGH